MNNRGIGVLAVLGVIWIAGFAVSVGVEVYLHSKGLKRECKVVPVSQAQQETAERVASK